MRRLSVWLIASLASTQLAAAEWRVISTTREPAAAADVEHRRVVVENPQSGQRATVDLALFSSKSATLRVIDDPEADDSLGEIMQREKCIAGVNGGYFDPDYAPVGLMISNGRVISPLRKARLLSGVVSVVNGRVQIQRAAAFLSKSKATAARQCGPFLVERGNAISGLNDTRVARRTFVATLGSERAAVGFCTPVTLAQLAALVAASELKIQQALNLDGGSSSGFWFAREDGVFSIREQKTVRDYIGVVAP